MSTPTQVTCPQCGRPIPADAPQQLCPHCALAGAATAPASGRPLTPAANLPSLDRVAAAFPNLEIIELLGAGGMGVVFKARQTRLDRHVALKLLPESLAQDPAFAERFHREARMLARLNHPNIVAVYDFGEAGGFYFLLMEYVDGVNLRQAMQAGRFSPAEALRTVPGICEALQFAHDEGILHRDVKPENILLDARGRVKIADFGIAKLIGGPSPDITLTGSGATVGTPQYMAPEQIERPRDVDHRADIYSLGVVFYEMLTGELPLGRFAAPSEKSAVGPQVDAIVMRTLEKERERRFQSATEVRTHVEDLAKTPAAREPAPPAVSHPPEAAPSAPPPPPRPDFILCDPRLPRLARALSVYVFLVAPVLWLLALMTHQPETHPSPYANFIANNANDLLTLAETAGLALLVTGGVLLRKLRPSAVTVLPLALLLRLGLLPLGFAAAAWVDRLNTTWFERLNRTPLPETPTTGGELVLTLLALASLVFELVACVWLLRRRRDLAALLAFHRHAESSRPASHSFGPADRGVSGSPPHATAAAVLTGLSLALGLAGLGGLAMYGVNLRTSHGSGGLGPFEVALLLLFPAAIIVGLGLVGFALGWRAARAQRNAKGTLTGTRRIVLGAFGWPLTLIVTVAGVASGWAFFRVSDSTLLALVLTLVFTLGSAEITLRSAWRWLHRLPLNQRGVQFPSWTHGFAAAAVIAVAVSAAPAGLLAIRSQQIGRVQPAALLVSPDPAIPPGKSGGRAAMQLEVVCPPRSIVWLRTALSRNGRLLRSPLSEDHVVNGSLAWSKVPVLLRAVEPGIETDPQWDLMIRAESGSAHFEYRSPESAGVQWTPIGLTEQVPVNLAETQSIEVLRGRGPAGDEWTATLVISFDPLPPAYTFEGVAAAPGRDWSATARPEETQGSNE